MSKTRGWVVGLLVGAMALGSGCKTMSNRDPGAEPMPPGTGGAGLDPNPEHNVPGSPMNPASAPINAPISGPDTTVPQAVAPQ